MTERVDEKAVVADNLEKYRYHYSAKLLGVSQQAYQSLPDKFTTTPQSVAESNET